MLDKPLLEIKSIFATYFNDTVNSLKTISLKDTCNDKKNNIKHNGTNIC